jgi:hypothetical protein
VDFVTTTTIAHRLLTDEVHHSNGGDSWWVALMAVALVVGLVAIALRVLRRLASNRR